jgi:glutamine amidotransferase
MCRFAAYLGPNIFISSLVTEPKHSLIHQSYQARERVEPLNGDGFGIGWYTPQFCKSPALYKEVSPAWSNHNLRDIARVTQSTCIFAHVRAATVGGELSRTNCHPFSWKKYLFMHNGTVFGFERIRRTLRRGLSDTAYDMIKGSTDSEHIFALFADNIAKISTPGPEEMKNALLAAMATVERLKAQAQVTEPSTMNLVLSDGKTLLATRYVSKGEGSNSLYYAETGRYSCREGVCQMDTGSDALLVVSEPLDTSKRWRKVENNHLVMTDGGDVVSTHPIELSL